MNNSPPDSSEDPLIPVRLSVLIGTFLGIREKGVPHQEIQIELRKIPTAIAAKYFHIQEMGNEYQPYVWRISEWLSSGAKLEKLQEESDCFNCQADMLTDWLVSNVPFLAGDKVFTRTLAFNSVKANNYDVFKGFGLDDEMIDKMKKGKYER